MCTCQLYSVPSNSGSNSHRLPVRLGDGRAPKLRSTIPSKVDFYRSLKKKKKTNKTDDRHLVPDTGVLSGRLRHGQKKNDPKHAALFCFIHSLQHSYRLTVSRLDHLAWRHFTRVKVLGDFPPTGSGVPLPAWRQGSTVRARKIIAKSAAAAAPIFSLPSPAAPLLFFLFCFFCQRSRRVPRVEVQHTKPPPCAKGHKHAHAHSERPAAGGGHHPPVHR